MNAAMKITRMNIKLLGTVHTVFRVFDGNGELVKVAETKEDAQQWVAQQQEA